MGGGDTHQRPRRLDAFELVPVLEIEARGGALVLLTGSRDENPDGWASYWTTAVAARGYTDVAAIEPGSWLVAVETMSSDSLLILVTEALTDSGFTNDLDTWSALFGGFMLRDRDGIVLRPTCCGDLANLDAWEDAAAYREEAWTMLWIGHPWVSVRADGDRLLVSDYHEDDSTLSALWSIDRQALFCAIAEARAGLHRFALRLERAVAQACPDAPPKKVASILAGLASALD